VYDKIRNEISADPWYARLPNDGQRFVAWYMRRVLLLDEVATRAALTDGSGDKQIDAIVVEDDDGRRVRVLQGKFVQPGVVDAEPLREVLSAWVRLKDLAQLQLECNGRLAERLEAMRAALEDDYELHFELLTTGALSAAATQDFDNFRATMGEDSELGASLTVVDSNLLTTRLSEAEQRDLPALQADVVLDPERVLVSSESGVRIVLAMLPLKECTKLPGIVDGKLFRRNVRQSLGLTNKVNKALRTTIVKAEKAPYFFFFHNGITALCQGFTLSEDRRKLTVRDLSVVNGCQSLSTIYATSGKVAEHGKGSLLFRLYEIPQRDLADEISVNTNSQSAVKPRDLRSNDKHMLAAKKRYQTAVPDGWFITKRGEKPPADRDPIKCIDAPDYAKAVMSWLAQRPNLASNERRLFDDYYKTIFHGELDAQSMLTLNLWLNEIDKSWGTLALDEAIKAVRGATRFHLLFVVSQLVAQASNQRDKVPLPAATVPALRLAPVVLSHATNCLNQAVHHADGQARAAGRIFSPQNWLKSKSALGDEQLVASTVLTVLKGMTSMPDIKTALDSLVIPADKFAFRWSAD
jgi:hypothetical protein